MMLETCMMLETYSANGELDEGETKTHQWEKLQRTETSWRFGEGLLTLRLTRTGKIGCDPPSSSRNDFIAGISTYPSHPPNRH